jgi:hypothetical protein
MKTGVSFRGLVGALIIAILMFVPAGLWVYGVPIPGKPTELPQPPAIASFHDLRALAVKSVHLETDLEGRNGDYMGKWSLHGEIIVAVDLGKAAYVRTDPQNRTATLRLPNPHVLTAKVDHQRSEEKYIRKVGWVAFSDPKNLSDEVWKMAEWKLEELGQDPRYQADGKAQAENVLRNLFVGAGWNVSFEWQGSTPPAAGSPAN